jgi:invasion protein IalB
MSFNRPAMGLLSAALLVAASVPTPAAAKPENGKRFGDWTVECEQPQGKPERCAISQSAMKDGNRVLTISIGHLGPKGETMMLAIVPLGVSLKAGAAYKIGNAKEVPMSMEECTMQGCLAVAPLPQAAIKALNEGQAMGIGVVPAGTEKIVGLPVSVNGFKEAFASLK